MTQRAVVQQALDVACAQHAALARGDVDAFIGGLDQQERTCAALAAAGISNGEEALVVDEVVTSVRESQAILDSLMDDLTRRMGHLRVAKTAATAYLSRAPRSAFSTQDA